MIFTTINLNKTLTLFLLTISLYLCNAQIIEYPYIEDFESGAGGWTIQGTNPSWELGEPNGSEINTAASGVNAWVTNLDGVPNLNENSWIQSPSFNFENVTNMFLQFQINVKAEFGDFAYVLYSIDDAQSWQYLDGVNGDVNWYDCPFNQPSWCDGSEWRTVIRPLDDFNIVGAPSVIFAIVFEKTTSDQLREGFAFDNVLVSDTVCYVEQGLGFEIENGSSLSLNDLLDGTLNRNTNGFSRQWKFINGPFGPRGPWVVSVSDEDEDEDEDDADFPNTGNGSDQDFTFEYTIEGESCMESAEISITMFPDAPSSEFSRIYICPNETIQDAGQLFEAFAMTQLRSASELWLYDDEEYSYNNILPGDFPLPAGTYYYRDSTQNLLIANVTEIDCSMESIRLSLANGQNTNDGINDYFEVDVLIESAIPSSNFKLGDGKVILNYSSLAFGNYIKAFGNVEVTTPNGYLANQGIDSDDSIKIYSDFEILDTVGDPGSFSWSFSQIESGLNFTEDNVTNVPSKLCHIKIKYEDVNFDPELVFNFEGIYENQFTTACSWDSAGGVNDCNISNRQLIINEVFDSTLSNNEYENNTLRLSPNPTSGIVEISGNMPQLNQIKVFSISGQLVKEVQMSQDLKKIDISDLNPGIYFFRLAGDYDSLIRKIIKL